MTPHLPLLDTLTAPARRRALAQLAALALAAATPRAWSNTPTALGTLASDPFPLGVASGPGLDGGVVLWTRVLPDIHAQISALSDLPLERYLAERSRMQHEAPTQPFEVRWELARDAAFDHIVQRGTAPALPELGHSVHVELPAAALRADTEYWYRFLCGDAVSTTGRTRTLPAPGADVSTYRLALASCQHYEYGHFGAYAHMLADDPHAVLFVGDYIYEGGPSAKRFRPHPFPAALTCFDYRLRHALYRLDPDLQRMHAHCPWWLTWDDHEVANDYAGEVDKDAPRAEHSKVPPNDLSARRRAAYQAYYEHMPLPARILAPDFDRVHLYRQICVGRLAQVFVLDDRQYRDRQACQAPGSKGSSVVDDATCPERLDAQRTLLGRTQMAWLQRGFAQSRARWNFIAQQTLFSPLRRDEDPPRYWTDGWDGYPAERERVLAALEQTRLRNPVMLGGDVHANWVCDIKRNYADPHSPTLGTEVCGTSITSASNWSAARTAQTAQLNPHVRFADNTRRGYALFDVNTHQMQITLRVVDDVRKPQPDVSTLARFEVAAGTPGAQRVD